MNTVENPEGYHRPFQAGGRRRKISFTFMRKSMPNILQDLKKEQKP